MKGVVVTGATGMIGNAFVQFCLSKGISVLAIVRPGSHKISLLPKHKMLHVLECDGSHLSTLKLEDKTYDVFYHFGWKYTSQETRNSPSHQTMNIQDTLDAVKLAKKLGCHTFIGAGSQAEYGPIKEQKPISPTTTLHPKLAYGMAKQSANMLSGLLCQQLNMKHIWARIFSVYGPLDGENTLISSAIRQLSKSEFLELTPCEQLWDFLYVGDCVNAFYLMGQHGIDQSIYCVGSGEAKPLRYFVTTLAKELNKEKYLKIGSKPYGENQVMFLQADISSLSKDTGFKPLVSFEEGIKKTIAHSNNK